MFKCSRKEEGLSGSVVDGRKDWRTDGWTEGRCKARKREFDIEQDLRIPYGHFNASIVDFDSLDLEVNTDGRLHRFESVIGETKQNTRLADAAIADQQDLERLIELHGSAIGGARGSAGVRTGETW